MPPDLPVVDPTVKLRTVLRSHFLAQIVCDHERKLDFPQCACATVDLGWHPSIGAAADAWVDHVAGQFELDPTLPNADAVAELSRLLDEARTERDEARDSLRRTKLELDHWRKVIASELRAERDAALGTLRVEHEAMEAVHGRITRERDEARARLAEVEAQRDEAVERREWVYQAHGELVHRNRDLRARLDAYAELETAARAMVATYLPRHALEPLMEALGALPEGPVDPPESPLGDQQAETGDQSGERPSGRCYRYTRVSGDSRHLEESAPCALPLGHQGLHRHPGGFWWRFGQDGIEVVEPKLRDEEWRRMHGDAAMDNIDELPDARAATEATVLGPVRVGSYDVTASVVIPEGGSAHLTNDGVLTVYQRSGAPVDYATTTDTEERDGE